MATRRVFRHVVVVVLLNHKTRKKKVQKNTQTDDEKDEKDETKNFVIFLRTKGMWMVMLFLVFGFLRTYS